MQSLIERYGLLAFVAGAFHPNQLALGFAILGYFRAERVWRYFVVAGLAQLAWWGFYASVADLVASQNIVSSSNFQLYVAALFSVWFAVRIVLALSRRMSHEGAGSCRLIWSPAAAGFIGRHLVTALRARGGRRAGPRPRAARGLRGGHRVRAGIDPRRDRVSMQRWRTSGTCITSPASPSSGRATGRISTGSTPAVPRRSCARRVRSASNASSIARPKRSCCRERGGAGRAHR